MPKGDEMSLMSVMGAGLAVSYRRVEHSGARWWTADGECLWLPFDFEMAGEAQRQWYQPPLCVREMIGGGDVSE